MAEERKGTSIFHLPKDAFGNIFYYFSLEEILSLAEVSRFFADWVNEFILFIESPKTLLPKIFSGRENSNPGIKKTFQSKILALEASRKVSFDQARLYKVDLKSFPQNNIELRGATCLSIPSGAVTYEKTHLLNSIELTLLVDLQDSYNLHFRIWQKWVVDKCASIGIKLDANAKDSFLAQCMLYQFGNLPPTSAMKTNLFFFLENRDFGCVSGTQMSENSLMRDRWSEKYKMRFSIVHPLIFHIEFRCLDHDTLSHTDSDLQFQDERAFMEGICQSTYEIQIDEVSKNYLYGSLSRAGVDITLHPHYAPITNAHYRLCIEKDYAESLFVTNPVSIACYLLDNLNKYVGEKDFVETCCCLQQEIEKFKGFTVGIPDEVIDNIYHNLAKKISANLSYQTIINQLKTTPDNKQACLEKFKAVMNAPDLSITDRAEIFSYFQYRIELNRHKNPQIDSFFGIKNTTSWRNTWKEIRDDAKQKLFNEVDKLENNKSKDGLLKWAKTTPLFFDHRNNSIFQGAFGRTQAVTDIETKEQSLKVSK